MDVLRFECSEYQLTISTADVSYAWERFERRVKDEAMSYCDYKSSCEGTLSLLNPRELSRGLHKQNGGRNIQFYSRLVNICLL